MSAAQKYRALVAYQRFIQRLENGWMRFLKDREDRLRHGHEAEKVAEAIIEDLFTGPMDWNKGDLLYQESRADIVLSENGIKHLVIEVKRPGTFLPNRNSLEQALQQARRYADEQHVGRIAVTDGCYFYAADIEHGGFRDRLFVGLNSTKVPMPLWWVSVHGIYKPCVDIDLGPLEINNGPEQPVTPISGLLLDPKYKLPAKCFAYVGDANSPKTWKLPHRLADGSVDTKRLPKAIQTIVTNYRGMRVKGIPEEAMPDVLKRLYQAACETGHISQDGKTSGHIYDELLKALEQYGFDSKHEL